MTLVTCYGLKYYLTLSLLIATKEKINQQFTFHKILRNKYSTICNNTFMLLIAHCIIVSSFCLGNITGIIRERGSSQLGWEKRLPNPTEHPSQGLSKDAL